MRELAVNEAMQMPIVRRKGRDMMHKSFAHNRKHDLKQWVNEQRHAKPSADVGALREHNQQECKHESDEIRTTIAKEDSPMRKIAHKKPCNRATQK